MRQKSNTPAGPGRIDPASLADAVSRAELHSPFLREAIDRNAGLLDHLRTGGADHALARLRSSVATLSDPAARLRNERSGTALIFALADLAGWHDFEATVAGLTRFADDALDRAISEAVRERTGVPDATGFAAIALGKQGGRELNYSSDIDPIFLYDPRTVPRRPREDAAQAAVRIARRVVDLLQTRTADGYVLRVDLRLRPSPEVSPIAVPVDAAIAYYESSALAWERAAFVRARAAAGDIELGGRFLKAIEPFVWRRSLDFGAIEEIAGISTRIREHYADRQDFGPGYDLKRGRGGIREIEFFTQIHQLIHGGRDPSLRSSSTLDALAALATAGRIARSDTAVLMDAYRTLRTIEHRLQMVDDRQTHSLPEGDALDGVARLHGLANGDALLDLLRPHVAAVRALYDALSGDAEPDAHLPPAALALEEELARAGFNDAHGAAKLITDWRSHRARSLRSPPARAAFEAMLPKLVAAVSRTPAPDAAFHRFDDIVGAVPSGINLYRLLDARPALVGLLAQILGHAPALATQLGRTPELLDGLIDASSLDPPPDLPALVTQLGRDLPPADHEAALRTVRRRVDEWRFALGVQLIAGHADPLDVSKGYARVAEAALVTLANESVRRFSEVHGHVPGSELVIVGLGRLGGGMLTHASDLDLVYLFTGGIDAASDGAKPLRATDYFNRLARRVTAALGLPTAAGPLYDVDTRLRPSGVHGMLAVTVDAFAEYQRGAAWTFEHMALTRARAVFGSPDARAAVDARIRSILEGPRDAATCLADAVRMRGEIARHKPPAGPFDVKLGGGGLVDLEFAVQVRQLIRRVGLDPRLDRAIAAQVAAGLLPDGFADAHRLLTRLLVMLRLAAPGGGEPDAASRPLVSRACRFEDWAGLCEALAEARRVVGDVWSRSVIEGINEC